MDPRLKHLLEMTSLYGTLAKYYEHIDPEKHMYFYQKHFMCEKELVQTYWALQHQPQHHPHHHHHHFHGDSTNYHM